MYEEKKREENKIKREEILDKGYKSREIQGSIFKFHDIKERERNSSLVFFPLVPKTTRYYEQIDRY